jgi:tetratricopeptide (TPR) repeat protein
MVKFPPSRAVCISALVAAVAVPLCAVLVVAQGQRRSAAPRPAAPPATPFEAATRLFFEGKYDDLDSAIERLDGRDPNVVALKARGMIARGKYADAETLLQPVVQRAPSSDAALELGLLQKMLGRPAATQTLERVAALGTSAQTATEMARAGRAYQALGRVKPEANQAFIQATRAAPNDLAIETAFGNLFLEKFDYANAMKSYARVLEIDPSSAPALLGAARALEDDDPPQAAGAIKRLLQINPSSVEAHIFLAGQAADVDHKAEARELLGKALAVNPSSLEAHSALAALAAVEDKTQEFDAEVAKVLAIAPTYGAVYRVAGELLARNYRFEEAVTMTRRALGLTPRDPQSLADLGAQLLRTGDEPGARQALETSYDLDPFNAVVVNSLRMLDNLDKFESIRDGDLIIRMHKDEAPVLKEYVIPLAHKALATMAAKYEMTVKGPILIEMFPKHDDFAVRTLGLPGMIGALGACFGQVVTLDSPKAKDPGDFLWEATLWHELGHVITIQMSNSRVPRWLTEGISEWEETQARKDWTRPGEAMFARTVTRGDAIKLKELNEAFQDPKRISLAYYQGRLVVDYMVQTFGQSGLNKLLRAYGQGLDTNAALKQTLNTDLDSMQSGFDRYIERTFGQLQKALTTPKDVDLGRATVDSLRTLARDNPQSYPVQVAFGLALRKAGSNDEAMQVFERAAGLAPSAVGPESPHAQMADIALEKKDRKRAIAELTALFAVDFENLGAAEQLADLLKEEGVTDSAKLRPVYERIVSLDPFRGEARSSLGRVAMQRNDYEFAAREFRTAIALKPIDPAVAHADLAESYLKAGKRDEAKRQALAALEIAPAYARAQDLLLQITDPAGARK